MKKTVSAIVPVFNEEKTVKGVVDVLLKSDLIDEVICVNDGSKDNSLEVLEGFGDKIKLINLKRNHGKGFAMAKGIKKAEGEIVAFFDSDLINPSSNHIKTLLEPILQDNTQAVLGYPKRHENDSSMINNMVSKLTGERAYFRDRLLPYLDRLSGTRLGAETFLNSLFKDKEMTIIPLQGLIHLRKYEKFGFSEAIKDYLKEGVEIAQEIGRREGLLPEDYQRIKDLAKIKTFKDFRVKINEIKNEPVRRFLKRYILRYAFLARKKLRDFYREL